MSSPRLEQLQAFLAKTPKEPFILFAIAKEHEKLQQLPDALEYYEQLRLDSPDYVGTYYHLGKLLEQLGQEKEAFFAYKQGIEVAKAAGDNHSLSELAGAKMELGDDDDFE
ncbi:MAG: tetratricopeptide repeat protein [Aureispira sp.]